MVFVFKNCDKFNALYSDYEISPSHLQCRMYNNTPWTVNVLEQVQVTFEMRRNFFYNNFE